jgi:glutamyl-tRNA synthetase
LNPGDTARIAATVPLVKEGAKTILDLVDLTAFVVKQRPLDLDAKTQQLLTEETCGRLQRLADHLGREADWTSSALEAQLKAFAAEENVGLGKFGPALRGVLSGGSVAPDLASALAALGKDESLGRIKDALSRAA